MEPFEKLVSKAKERIDKLNEKRSLYSKYMTAMDRYIVCEGCGNAYGNEYLLVGKWETVDECLICEGNV
jgi:hypothetical protein